MFIFNLLRYGLLFVGFVAAAANVEAATYFGYDKFGDGILHDAEQDNPQLCWAAALSNVLAWGGWGSGRATTEQVIYEELQPNLPNTARNEALALSYWFYGLDGRSGGDHWSNVKDIDNFHSVHSIGIDPAFNAFLNIDDSLRKGMGTTITITSPNEINNHDFTVWGYEYSDTSPQNYQGIWYTDSAERVQQGKPHYINVSKSNTDDTWKIGGQTGETCSASASKFACDTYKGWSITQVQALAPRKLSLLSGTWLSTKERPEEDALTKWTEAAFDDNAWTAASAPYPNLRKTDTGDYVSITTPENIVSGTKAKLMWIGDSEYGTGDPDQAYFRLKFHLALNGDEYPYSASVKIIADDVLDLWVNGTKCLNKLTLDNGHLGDDNQPDPYTLGSCDNGKTFRELLRQGDNVIAIWANDGWPGETKDRGYQYVFVDGSIETFAPISEPSTMVLFGSAFMGLLISVKRKRGKLVKHGRTAKSAATLMPVSDE